MSIRIVIAVLSASALWGAPSLAHVPLTFEPSTRASEFIASTGGLNVVVTPSGATLEHRSMRLIGVNSHAPAVPEELLASYSNYLIDRDPRKWRTHVPNYRRVRYRNVYPGIDVVYYGNPRELEFDFLVAPGADVQQIRIALSSQDLSIRLPRIYQNDRTIEGRAIRRGKYVTFELPAYDHSQPLVIDPVLSYAAVFGGGGADQGRVIAVDASGASYVAGIAGSSNFPVVKGQSLQSGSFLAKISPAGDALVYSTYLPFPIGANPGAIAIDSSGNLYSAGPFFTTPNGSTPPVVGPLAQCIAGVQAVLYVAKMSFDGASLVYSGCIAGTTFAGGPTVIASDGSGNAYVGGSTQSSGFPLVNPLPYTPPSNFGPPRAFVLKLGPNGALLYSSFVGGSNGDMIRAIAADPAGSIYLIGQTNSPDFPIKNAIQPRPPSGFPSFVSFLAKIKADGSDYVYSTYFGGSNGDSVLAIAADTGGKTYLAGSTTSGDFPITANALQNHFDGTFLFKTTDAAKTWGRSDRGLPATATVVQVDPQESLTVYAVSSGGLFKSTDGGVTWHGTAAAAVSSLWIDPVDSTLYIGTTHGDFVRSRDGGATFVPLANALGGSLNGVAFDSTNRLVIYARWGGHGSTDGIYKSIDGGDTWKPTGLVGAMNGSGPFAVDPARPSILYAEGRNRGLLESSDGGNTWDPLGGDVNQIIVDSKSTLFSTYGSVIHVYPLGGVSIDKVAPGTVGTLLLDPTNSSIWYATIYASNGPGIYKTTDGGDTWQLVNSGLPSSLSATSLALDPSTPQTLYLGTLPNSDGFFAVLRPDGASLEYSTYLGGNGTDAAVAIAVDPAGNSYLTGTTDSIDFPLQAAFRQTGSGFAAKFDATDKLAWSSLLGGASPTAIALGSNGEVYLTGSATSSTFSTPGALGPLVSGNFFHTTDGGKTWTGTTLPTVMTPVGVSAVVVDANNSSHVYALADRLYASNDGGQTWLPLGSPIPTPYIPVPYGAPVKLLIDPVNASTVYVAGGFCAAINGVFTGCGVSKSVDGGATWTTNQLVPMPLNFQPVIASGLAIDSKTPSILYAATDGGVYKSTDGGVTWKISGGFQIGVLAVAIDPANSSIVYTSISTTVTLSPTGPVLNPSPGIFKSTDAGATWAPINGGLPSGWYANALIVDPSVPQRIFAVGASASPGLYRSDDGGNHWSSIGSGLPNSPVNGLALAPSNSSTLYAGPAAGGLYRSQDAGMSWSQLPGMSVPIVYAIAVAPTDSSRIYAGAQLNPADAFVMKIVP